MSSTFPDNEPLDVAAKLFDYTKSLGLDPFQHKKPGLTMNTVFFDPSPDFVKWIGEYAAGRLIVDLGCGTGSVIKRLYLAGFESVCGVEPHWDYAESLRWREKHNNILQVMQYYVQEPVAAGMFESERPKLFLCCRPSHGAWVEYAAEKMGPESEMLLIQKPETFDKARDTGRYHDQLVPLIHQGASVDNERVWSLKKEWVGA